MQQELGLCSSPVSVMPPGMPGRGSTSMNTVYFDSAAELGYNNYEESGLQRFLFPEAPSALNPDSSPRKLYIAGPMTGYADFNFPMFNAVAKSLREAGYEVVNPAELGFLSGDTTSQGSNNTSTFKRYMSRDLPALLSCDGVATLPGYRSSHGAKLEVAVARACDMPVALYEVYLDGPTGYYA